MIAIRAARPCLVAGLLALATMAGATTYLVNPSTGNNGNSGTAVGQEFQTLAHALSVAVDGDTISLTGLANESITVDKDVTITGGTIRCPTFPGVRITADGVRLSNIRIEQDAANLAAGTLLLVEQTGGDGFIDGIELQSVVIDTAYGLGTTSGGSVTGAHFIKARGLSINGMYVEIATGANPDIGLILEGGGTDPVTQNGIVIGPLTIECSQAGPPWPSQQGTAMVMRPATGMGLSNVRLDTTRFAFAFDTGLVIEDTGTGPSEGIWDVRARLTSIYGVNTSVDVIAQGSSTDSGTGISDVLFYGNDGYYGFLADERAFRFTQSSSGTPRIDASSFRVTQTSLSSAMGVENFLESGIVDFEHCWWLSPSGPGGAGPGTGTPVSSNVDFTPWTYGDLVSSDVQWVDTPGGTASFDLPSGPQEFDINVDLDPGVTGRVEAMALSNAIYPWGTAGILDAAILPGYLHIDSDLVDGTFVALVQARYNSFTVTNTLGITEEEVHLYFFDDEAGNWRPAVEGNVGGSRRWEGAAPVPALPLTHADVGRHGVDVDANIVWAVVDHFTEFTGGKGSNGGGGLPSSEHDWRLYD